MSYQSCNERLINFNKDLARMGLFNKAPLEKLKGLIDELYSSLKTASSGMMGFDIDKPKMKDIIKDSIANSRVKRLIPKYMKLKIMAQDKELTSQLDSTYKKRLTAVVAGMEIYLAVEK